MNSDKSPVGGEDEMPVPEGSAESDGGSAQPAGDGGQSQTQGEFPAEAGGDVDDLDARVEAIFEEELDPLAEAIRARDEYLDNLQRLQAEFDNYRKRVTRQSEELTERAAAAVLERMLPALDALDLARTHAGEPADAVAAQLAEALGQIASLARDALAKDGLDRIDEVGVEFDPSIHDAVAHDAADDDAHTGVVVSEILRPGYRLKGCVVRPAMVRVKG